MPTFSYQAIDVDGRQVAGTLEASGLSAAIDKVRALGLFPDSVKDDSGESDDSPSFFDTLAGLRFGKKAREAGISLFTRELADLLAGGVSLPLSLSILHDRQKPGKLKNVLHELATDVEAGVALSDALDTHRLWFDEIFVDIIRAAEEKKALPKALHLCDEIVKNNHALELKARCFVDIPLKLILTACLYFIFFITISFPPFANIFMTWRWAISSRKAFLLDTYNLIHGSSLEIVCAFIVAILAFKALLRIRILRSLWDATLLLLPVWGNITRKITTVKFARTLGALIRFEIPFGRAIDIAANTIGNSVLKKNALIQVNNILNGERVSPLRKRFRLLNPHTLNLIYDSRGEKAVSTILSRIADTCEQEVTHLMGSVILLVTPCLIFLIGWGLLNIIAALFAWNGSVGDLV
jgi:type II secretory pathway component PulF